MQFGGFNTLINLVPSSTVLIIYLGSGGDKNEGEFFRFTEKFHQYEGFENAEEDIQTELSEKSQHVPAFSIINIPTSITDDIKEKANHYLHQAITQYGE